MVNKLSTLKSIALGAALLAGASSIVQADDNSTNPFTGESYFYFKNAQAVSASAPSSWRQSDPNGLSLAELQASWSDGSPAWLLSNNSAINTFAANNAPSDFRQSHPHGLSTREIQALSSSGAPLWQFPDQSATAFASANGDGVTNTAAR